MNHTLRSSYSHCATVARTRARNFYYGFFMLPPEKRRAMHAIYAFMRSCDDIADDAPEGARAAQLAALRRSLDQALSGDSGTSPIFPAFRDAVERYGIPADYFHAVIDGAEMDLSVTRYATFAELRDYCYRVASAVGLVCLHVFGAVDEESKRRAEECGMALQLTNILRDLREDAERGRIYLPLEDLDRFGCTEEGILTGKRDEHFRDLMAFEAARARTYYRTGEALIGRVPRDSRACLAAMLGIYEGVLDRIETSGFDVYSRRAGLSACEKASVALRAWWQHRRDGGQPSKT